LEILKNSDNYCYNKKVDALEVMDFAAEQHIARRRIWAEKYAIRACYRGWYRRMEPFVAPGRSLEVGAGSGDFGSFWPGLIVTDIVPVPWLDLVADGMRLPVADASLANIVVIDLLHHLQDPHQFFREVSRALRPGGRLLAIEPYITPVSYLGYRLCHHEDIWFGGFQKPRSERTGPETAKEDPWQGNLALPNQLFGRHRRAWLRQHPSLRIIQARKFGLFDFQLAAGFKPRAYVGNPRLYDFVLGIDRRLDWLGWLCGFRMIVVIERV
jgi:SAM-dependent methyltransferase